MDVLLVRPPEPQMSRFYNKGESLGLGYLAAVLRQANFEVEILDCVLFEWDHQRAVMEISRRNFRVLGLTVFAVAMDDAARLVDDLRRNGCDAHVTLGGHFPSFRAVEVLTEFPAIDSVVKFEGEFALAELAAAVRDGTDLAQIRGLIYRADEVICVNDPRPPILDLDALPFPARDLLATALRWERDAYTCTSRGCWARCTYCSIAPFSRQAGNPAWRARSPQNVVDEFESLVRSHAPRAIGVVDADFVGPGKVGRRRAMAIADEILARRLDVVLGIYTRVDEVDRELFAHLRAAGMTTVYLGIESGVQSALDRWNKRTTVEQNFRALDVCEQLGIRVEAGFMLFDPHTTLDEIRENLRFLSRTEVFDFPSLLARMEVRPGMPMEAQLRQEGRLIGGYRDSRYLMSDPRAEAFHAASCRLLEPLACVYLELRDLRHEVPAGGQGLDLARQRLNRKALAFVTELAEAMAAVPRELWPPEGSVAETVAAEAALAAEVEREARRLRRVMNVFAAREPLLEVALA